MGMDFPKSTHGGSKKTHVRHPADPYISAATRSARAPRYGWGSGPSRPRDAAGRSPAAWSVIAWNWKVLARSIWKGPWRFDDVPGPFLLLAQSSVQPGFSHTCFQWELQPTGCLSVGE
jgi:hypothetical protein